MIARIFATALGAGCVAGLILAVLQAVFTVPIILQAETYETAANSPLLHNAVAPTVVASANDVGIQVVNTSVAGHADHGRFEPDAPSGSGLLDTLFGDWAPRDGIERTFFTSLTSVLVGFGFGLILLAAMLLGARKIDANEGLLWGIGGFAAVALAPALGLAPEIPGSAAAALVDRQVWWIGTAIATGIGLWLIVAKRKLPPRLAGLLIVVAPHAIGAPLPQGYVSTAPAEIAGQFAAASLVSAAVFWAVLGSTLGFIWQRQERTA